jgi:hypothetical protein
VREKAAYNIGIAKRWGWTLKQSAAVILLCCGSGLDEQSPTFSSYYLTLSKSQAAVPGGRI